MDQRAWVVVLVTTHGFASGPVDMGQPAQPVPDQDFVHRRGGDTGPSSELKRAQRFAPPQNPAPAAPPAEGCGPADGGAGCTD